MTYVRKQADFYDLNPPLLPWPELLQEYGFDLLYKPREIFWKKYINELHIKSEDRILDVGCGQGLTLARICKTYKCSGVGIDVSAKSISFANKHFGNKNISYQVTEGLQIPFRDNTFNSIVSFDVLEHIEDQEGIVREMIRILKPGGKMLIYTLNSNDTWTLDWFWEKIGIDIYSRAAHKRELFVNPLWLTTIVEKYGAKKKDICLFDAFFTLGLDESIMIGVAILKMLHMNASKFIGRVFLLTTSLLSYIVYTPLFMLDSLWFRKGRSLSFIMMVQKNK